MAKPEMECLAERDVVEAVEAGRWPDGCADELRRHVEHCAVCAEVAEVAALVRADFQRARQDASVPTAERVWWRAQMRARQEALQIAERPVTITQSLVAAGSLGFAAAAFGAAWSAPPEFWSAFGVSAFGLSGRVVDWSSAASVAAAVVQTPRLALAVAALAAGAVLAPLAVYLTLSEK